MGDAENQAEAECIIFKKRPSYEGRFFISHTFINFVLYLYVDYILGGPY